MIVSRRSEALTAPAGDGSQGAFHQSPAPGALTMPHVEGVEHRFVRVNGARLHYAGAGRGDPLVLLHGWPQHWWAWREVIPTLAKSYRVICPDIRGFGWSDGGQDYGLEQLAADLVGLLDELGVDRARLVGHDWGSEIGYRACLNWPGRFSQYVPIGGVTPWSAGRASPRAYLRSWHIYALGLLGTGASARLGVPERALRTWRHVGRFTPEETQTYLEPLGRPVSADATRLLYRHALFHELPNHVRNHPRMPLPVPTLHLDGAMDPLAGGVTDAFRRFEGDIQSELVPDCGHFLAEERPAWLLDRLNEFLI